MPIKILLDPVSVSCGLLFKDHYAPVGTEISTNRGLEGSSLLGAGALGDIRRRTAEPFWAGGGGRFGWRRRGIGVVAEVVRPRTGW